MVTDWEIFRDYEYEEDDQLEVAKDSSKPHVIKFRIRTGRSVSCIISLGDDEITALMERLHEWTGWVGEYSHQSEINMRKVKYTELLYALNQAEIISKQLRDSENGKPLLISPLKVI